MLPDFTAHTDHAQAVIAAVLESADAAAALRQHWKSLPAPCHVLAVGKASGPMLKEAVALTGGRILAAITTSVPELCGQRIEGVPVQTFACDHPYPTKRNLEAAHAVERFVRALRHHDTLVVLISGGGSAHLTLPAGDVTLADIAQVTKALQLAGATINELNCVRKHCELLKGGRLAAASGAGTILAYILSDVIGDPLDVISSGPTAPDTSTYAQALDVLASRRVVNDRIRAHLLAGAAGHVAETPKPGDPLFARVTNTIIASNASAVQGAADALQNLGFQIAQVRTGVTGEASDVAAELVNLAMRHQAPGPTAWLWGGETTVTVNEGTGEGGPSQELALAASGLLAGAHETALMTFSTDGRDGPTDAAGAVVTGETWAKAAAGGVDPAQALQRHDSHRALAAAGALIRTGATGTNLNHVAVLMRYGSRHRVAPGAPS